MADADILAGAKPNSLCRTKNHLGIYPGAEAMKYFAPRLTDYKTSKGAIQFPYKTFGVGQLAIISEIAAWCGKENAKV